ncbi:purine and uridine phosphorylase [Trichoderma compactum]
MLDLQHPPLSQDNHDLNSYAFGCISNHNVVIACLPSGVHDTVSAASVLNDMRRSFKSLRFCLMVGIGGAVPCTPSDIRLGDIFVSNPAMNSGGVIQYDSGKIEQDGEFVQTGSLDAPPISLRTAVSAIQANHDMFGPKFPDHLEDMFKTYNKMEKKYSRPPPEADILFNSNYDHPKNDRDCSQCDQDQRKSRSARDSETVVHYGLIASGDKVMKHGTTRDKLWNQHGIECFEMEAAGLMNNFQCLVIRGISDYAIHIRMISGNHTQRQ